ncbi:uncharacterized protein LOC135202898 [Macrobrachium nipponense]|uniref:uncharacterized protein LOC135202898 n=1 Tax=Macrobrachium nipponense TaxID=159736 RepID=UPI0030C7F468
MREDNTTSFRKILVLNQLEEKKKERREIKRELDTLQTQRQTASQGTPRPDIDAALQCRQQKDYRKREMAYLRNLELKETAKNLKANQEITIRRADKAAALVLIKTSEYYEKLDQILADQSKFRKINTNPIEDIRQGINRTVERIDAARNAPMLPLAQGDFNPGYIYGTVKIHKPGNPLCPIISQIPTPTYKIAKRLNELLMPYIPDRYCLQSSTNFLRDLRDSPSTGIIASLDVEGLFTNVPVDETIEHILDRVYRCEDTQALNIPVEALNLGQIDGVAMGYPLGVLFANFYMSVVEERVFNKIPCPPQYYRYIDDTFIRVDLEEDLETLRKIFKECSVLHFTCERSVVGALPFLDLIAKTMSAKLSIAKMAAPNRQRQRVGAKSSCSDKISLIIYYKNMKTSQLLLKNNPAPPETSLKRKSVIYEFTCSGDG